MKHLAIALAATLAVGATAPALADTVLVDQTSATYDWGYLSDIFTKTNACGCSPLDSSTLADTFTLTSESKITSVQAALTAFQQNPVSNFTGFGAAIGYQVNVYSSAAAAAADLTGDVYSETLLPSAVSFGASQSLSSNLAPYVLATTLATLPANKVLAAGTYWLSVIGIDNPDDNESIGVLASDASGGAAVGVNPGGDLGFPVTPFPTGTTAGYAVYGVAGVPEPASWALMIVGFGVVGAGLRSRGRRLESRLISGVSGREGVSARTCSSSKLASVEDQDERPRAGGSRLRAQPRDLRGRRHPRRRQAHRAVEPGRRA